MQPRAFCQTSRHAGIGMMKRVPSVCCLRSVPKMRAAASASSKVKIVHAVRTMIAPSVP